MIAGCAATPSYAPEQLVSMQPYYDKIYQACMESRAEKYKDATPAVCEGDTEYAIELLQQGYSNNVDEEKVASACAQKPDATACIKTHQQRYYSSVVDRIIPKLFGR